MIKKYVPSSARNADRTRRMLLSAAADAFAELGFEGSRTRDIAARAGVNQALIRYYFNGKTGLYKAVILDVVNAAAPHLATLRESSASPIERLRDFITLFARMVEERPHSVTLLLREYLSGGTRLTPEVMTGIGAFFSASRTIVEEGLRQDIFRDVDAHSLHLSLVGSIAFFFASQRWREGAAERKELPAPAPTTDTYIQHLQELVLRGICKSESP